VVGCGRVGSQLATLLSVEGHNVVVIDRDAESFKRLGTTFNGVTIKGLGFDEEVLEEAGTRDCDAFAAVTNLDNTNLMAAEVARKIFNVPHAVARLYNPVRERTYQQLGLDYVCGTTLVAETLLDKIMADIEIDRRFRIAVVARGESMFVPELGTILHAGDIIVASVKDETFPKLERFMEE